ncbi:hypothetical protein K501DRAFT_305946 [Backusella circina FSU 941]|nr:hypothetical protein K501DRAFT_305946 [Backusella circina FSU 941]
MTRMLPLSFELFKFIVNLCLALVFTSWLFSWSKMLLILGLICVCRDFLSLVIVFSAWEVIGDSFECPPSEVVFVEASTFSNTPEATPVRNTVTAFPSGVYVGQVRRSFDAHAAVVGRSRLLEVHWNKNEEGESPQSTTVEDHAVTSEAEASSIALPGSTPVRDANESSAEVPVTDAYGVVAHATWSTEYDSPSVVDPWFLQGVAAFEHMPEMPDVDVLMEEVNASAVDFDVVMAEPDDEQPTESMGAFFTLQELSGIEECEDIFMTEVFTPGEDMDVDIQEHMEYDSHSMTFVDPVVHVADVSVAETTDLEGDLLVVSEASPETPHEQRAVLDQGAFEARPTRPSSPLEEVLLTKSPVLSPVPQENEGPSEDRSLVADPFDGTHLVGCTCATCAEEAEDLEEKLAIWASFEDSEEEDDGLVPV